MIADFLASWSLFGTTYVAGLLVAFTLGLIGVWVVARNQVFLGVAVAQASTLGVAVALWVQGLGALAALEWLHADLVAAGLAVVASIATALLTAREAPPGRESVEAVTGWVYLLAASLPVLLLARSPHGLEEVHQLIFSTLLGAAPVDVWIFAVLAVASAVLAASLRDRLLLFALDPETAAAVGMRRARWSAGAALWLGLAVGLSIRVSGTLFTFGCLVLPALVAKQLVREIRPLLVVAPAIAVTASILGFFLAHAFDVPPAHLTVALLCAALLGAWTRRLRRGD